jgi:quercetin 2,3-dioxygenase
VAAGNVQYLSAGTGVTHSEMNNGAERSRFIQVWLTPDRKGHAPQYGSTVFKPQDRHNRLLHMLGGTGSLPDWPDISEKAAVALHQDCNVFVSESDAGQTFSLPLAHGRQVYALCMEGSMHMNDAKLEARDAAEVVPGPEGLTAEVAAGEKGCHFMLVEMQHA